MNRGSFWFIAALACAGGYTALNLVRMEKQADRFMQRLFDEILTPYDQTLSPEFYTEPILKIASQEGVEVARENIFMGPIDPEDISKVSAIEAMGHSALGEVVAIKVKFVVKRSLFTRNFERAVDKALDEGTYHGVSGSSPGFPVGVDVPVPARSAPSYRQDVRKAIGERADY